jgi:hypothetical protein
LTRQAPRAIMDCVLKRYGGGAKGLTSTFDH